MATESTYFDRQERITWWDQEKLFNARVLVIGAGALGNEVLKNLALLGVGHILVIDFDVIEDSNLSRSVLFRTTDAVNGAKKAEVAAKRAQSLNPNPHAVVQFIHGDVVWELGLGVYRHVDIVIGCLDNLEARLSVNLKCWQVGKTWIDGGMWELSGNVAVFDASNNTACYECSMTTEHYRLMKTRYSCTNETIKSNIRQGREPTTQTTSAIIASIQTQEAVKILHQLPSFPGRRLIFNGASHFYTDSDYTPMMMAELTLNSNCLCHGEEHYEEILSLHKAQAERTTARELLKMVEAETGNRNLKLELGYKFVIEAICPKCDKHIQLNRPLFHVRDVDTVCPTCEVTCPTCGFVSQGKPDCPNCTQPDIIEPRLLYFHTLSQDDPSTTEYLDYTLARLGIPPLHILTIRDRVGNRILTELQGDLTSLWSVKKSPL